MKRINYSKLLTEQVNPASGSIDRLPVEKILRLMNREDQKVPRAVEKQIPQISRATDVIVRSLKVSGRIFFVGAGTSGRLGVIEAAELPPTFNTPPSVAQAIMAGGRKAVFQSQEGAEDNAVKAQSEVRKKVKPGDVLIGIAASGVTPFVQAALAEAKRKKAATIFVTCNITGISRWTADVVIAPLVGPELITGSTRLKAATATKLVLNMMTVASMVRLGKVYGNRMVDLQPKSRKLNERGIRLVEELAGVSRQKAAKLFKAAGRNVKVAVLMAKRGLIPGQAKERLKQFNGFLAEALGS